MQSSKVLASQVLQSNAKINIGLNIVDKKNNGYHKIESLIQEINLFDIIEITIFKSNGKTKIISSGISIDCEPHENTCYKMIELLKKQ